MFKNILEIDRPVLNRVIDKITEQNLPIETEIGLVKHGMVKVLFIYEDRQLLDWIISESINEEYDL